MAWERLSAFDSLWRIHRPLLQSLVAATVAIMTYGEAMIVFAGAMLIAVTSGLIWVSKLGIASSVSTNGRVLRVRRLLSVETIPLVDLALEEDDLHDDSVKSTVTVRFASARSGAFRYYPEGELAELRAYLNRAKCMNRTEPE